MFSKKKDRKGDTIIANCALIAGPRLLRITVDGKEISQIVINRDVLAYMPTKQVIHSVRDNSTIGTHNKVLGNGTIVAIQNNEVCILMEQPLLHGSKGVETYLSSSLKSITNDKTGISNNVHCFNDKKVEAKKLKQLSLGKIIIRQLREPDAKHANFKDMLLE